MRHFVLCERDGQAGDPFILAEVVRTFGEDVAISVASSLAGARTRILTRAELLSTPEGRRALGRWEQQDDDAFDDETRLLGRASRRTGTTRLRAVPDIDPHRPSPTKTEDS